MAASPISLTYGPGAGEIATHDRPDIDSEIADKWLNNGEVLWDSR